MNYARAKEANMSRMAEKCRVLCKKMGADVKRLEEIELLPAYKKMQALRAMKEELLKDNAAQKRLELEKRKEKPRLGKMASDEDKAKQAEEDAETAKQEAELKAADAEKKPEPKASKKKSSKKKASKKKSSKS